jgi:hypothetical protein
MAQEKVPGMAQETAEALETAAQKALAKAQALEKALARVRELELRVSDLEMALDSARAKLMVRD